MKHIITSCLIAVCAMTANAQQTPVYLDETQPIEQRIDDALSRMTLQEKIRVIHAQSKFSSAGIPRLGFPDFWTDDGPHGVRPDVLWDEWEQAGQTNDSCVAFPALTCLAATWNPDLAALYGKSLGEEALYRGKDMILGPGVNIYRTPLGDATSSIWAKTLIWLPRWWCLTYGECSRWEFRHASSITALTMTRNIALM